MVDVVESMREVDRGAVEEACNTIQMQYRRVESAAQILRGLIDKKARLEILRDDQERAALRAAHDLCAGFREMARVHVSLLRTLSSADVLEALGQALVEEVGERGSVSVREQWEASLVDRRLDHAPDSVRGSLEALRKLDIPPEFADLTLQIRDGHLVAVSPGRERTLRFAPPDRVLGEATVDSPVPVHPGLLFAEHDYHELVDTMALEGGFDTVAFSPSLERGFTPDLSSALGEAYAGAIETADALSATIAERGVPVEYGGFFWLIGVAIAVAVVSALTGIGILIYCAAADGDQGGVCDVGKWLLGIGFVTFLISSSDGGTVTLRINGNEVRYQVGKPAY